MPDYYRRTKNKVNKNGDCCIVFGESQGFMLGIFKKPLKYCLFLVAL